MKDVLQRIATMQTAQMTSSDIRIFCDNDRRWVLYPDNTQLPEERRNSRLPPDQQYWWDPINLLMRHPSDYGVIVGNVHAQTYVNSFIPEYDQTGQPFQRSVLTVSQRTLWLRS